MMTLKKTLTRRMLIVDVDDATAKMMIKCFFGMKTMNRQFRIENFFNFLEPFDTHFSKIRIPSTKIKSRRIIRNIKEDKKKIEISWGKKIYLSNIDYSECI